MTTTFDPYLTRVLTSAIACPEPLAIRHIRDTAIDFCERTRVWRLKQSYALTITSDPVLLVAPSQSQIQEIRSAVIDIGTRPLERITSQDLDALYPLWRTETPTEGGARYITQIGLDSVSVYPRSLGNLLLEAILVPLRTATTLPDILFENYVDTITSGALAKVLITPARDFTNPQLGATHYQLYENAVDSLVGKVARGQQRAPLRTKPQFV